MFLEPSPPNRIIKNHNITHAWLAITLFVFSVVALLIIGAGKILSLLYPLGALGVGIFLYRRYPIIYLSFTLWIFCTGNLVTRLIGYQLGGMGPLGSALALVPFITLCTLLKNLPTLYRRGDGFPFILCLGAVFYGWLIKLVHHPLGDFNGEINTILSYFTPILFGLHLYINWQHYPRYRENIQKTFLWIVLATSMYGIWQFIIAPPWDTNLMRLTWGENSWMGKTEPLGIRVFSTMVHPFAYALNLMPGLLLLNISNSKLRWIAMVVGYLALLLTTYRTAWYSLFIATLTLIVSLKLRKKIQILFGVIFITISCLLMASVEPFSSVIIERFNTFSNLQNLSEDGSGAGRLDQYKNATNILMTEFIGFGLGGESSLSSIVKFSGTNEALSGYDNGIYGLLSNLGWIGTIPFIIGMVLILYLLFWKFSANHDVFALSARAIVFASLIRIPTSSIIISEFAWPLWLFIGLSMAAQKYYTHQKYIQSHNLDKL